MNWLITIFLTFLVYITLDIHSHKVTTTTFVYPLCQTFITLTMLWICRETPEKLLPVAAFWIIYFTYQTRPSQLNELNEIREDPPSTG